MVVVLQILHEDPKKPTVDGFVIDIGWPSARNPYVIDYGKITSRREYLASVRLTQEPWRPVINTAGDNELLGVLEWAAHELLVRSAQEVRPNAGSLSELDERTEQIQVLAMFVDDHDGYTPPKGVHDALVAHNREMNGEATPVKELAEEARRG